MIKYQNVRVLAAILIQKVIENRKSFSYILAKYSKEIKKNNSVALLKEICFGVFRTLTQMEWLANKIMSYQITGKQRIIHYLILVGLYQLIYMRIPSYAVISETVNSATVINRSNFKKLINAVLRQFQRKQKVLLTEFLISEYRYLHPQWMIKCLQKNYPTKWQKIIEANNQHPPMWLRVNRNYHTRDKWLDMISKAGIQGFSHADFSDAVCISPPIDIQDIPGFEKGWVTIQDISSQSCMKWLQPKNNEFILDLCAAPGGKTTHILEIAPKAKVMAVDINKKRLSYVYENLKRLKVQAEVRQGDACTPLKWCNKKTFDKILIDAPCTSTGVIRRHPDIKWLRKYSDIEKFSSLQKKMLHAIWPCLKSKGTLVYSTCSILPEENSKQIFDFLRCTNDAILSETGNYKTPGIQNFPSTEGGDGFFCAKIIKS